MGLFKGGVKCSEVVWVAPGPNGWCFYGKRLGPRDRATAPGQEDSHRHAADRADRGPPAPRSVRPNPRPVATWSLSSRSLEVWKSAFPREQTSGPCAGAEVLKRLPARAFGRAASFRASRPREAYAGATSPGAPHELLRIPGSLHVHTSCTCWSTPASLSLVNLVFVTGVLAKNLDDRRKFIFLPCKNLSSRKEGSCSRGWIMTTGCFWKAFLSGG